MYDVSGGGSYIDAALCATGISDEQLMQNLCSRLYSKINETECNQWPPRTDKLEEKAHICYALVQFLSWVNPLPLPSPSAPPPPPPPKKKHLDFSSKKLCLASIITQYVTGKRTTTAIKHEIDLHGYTVIKTSWMFSTIQASSSVMPTYYRCMMFRGWKMLQNPFSFIEK